MLPSSTRASLQGSRAVRVEAGNLVWPNGADPCPDVVNPERSSPLQTDEVQPRTAERATTEKLASTETGAPLVDAAGVGG